METEMTFFDRIMQQRVSRRSALAQSSIAATGALAAPKLIAGAGRLKGDDAMQFDSIAPETGDATKIADGHKYDVLLRWGDPLFTDAPAFDLAAQTPAAQARQFGFNCDFAAYFPLGNPKKNRGILVINHEYTDGMTMFPGYNKKDPTRDQVDIELAAHGLSVVEIKLTNGHWSVVLDSPFNRRITGETLMELTGPAAGTDGLKTPDDPTGRAVRGTLNNCGGGKTPWGTVITAEENFNQYFANSSSISGDALQLASLKRYGLPAANSERLWENFHDRFDLAKQPNEANRQGWLVEFDPYDANSIPKKRTALGRMAHEAAAFAIGKTGRVVAYTGDDARFEYLYKFVSTKKLSAKKRETNMDLLDEGTLYVAKFHDDGTGEWLPLVWGQGELNEANGFVSQADVLIYTRLAADLVGATKMDRPEDVDVNPKNGKVYMALTNNNRRTASDVNAANPRPENKFGHIMEISELNNDHEELVFAWEIFMLCGDPASADTYFAGFDKSEVSKISCPDNLAFDALGNLWIVTDGQPNSIGVNDGAFVVPTDGTDRGHLKQFFSAVTAAEVCGPEFTPDNKTLFLCLQHPGEGSDLVNPTSQWPDYAGFPRPSLIAIQETNGERIGRPQI